MSVNAQVLPAGNVQLQTYYQELERDNSRKLDSSRLLTALVLCVFYTGLSSFLTSDNSWVQFGLSAFFLLSTAFFATGLWAWYARYNAFGSTYNDKREPDGQGYPLSSMRLNQILTFTILGLLVFALMPSAHANEIIDMSGLGVSGVATDLAKQLIVLGAAVLGGVLIIFGASAGVPLGKRMIWSML